MADVMDFSFDQFDTGLGGSEGFDALMPSLDLQDNDWSAVLSTIFDGSSFTDPGNFGNINNVV